MIRKRFLPFLLLSLVALVPAAAQAAKLATPEALYEQQPNPGFILSIAPQDDPLLRLVNRENRLPSSFKPKVVTPRVAKKRSADIDLQSEAATALEAMFLAAESEGLRLVAVSGYRSYGKQKTLYARSVERNGQEKADRMSAQPGASEHQLGLSIDLSCASLDNILASKFARKAEGKWVATHCAEFGYIVRYQDAWSSVTGYQGEPWHIRYIGSQHARLVNELNVPLETYLAYLDLVWRNQPTLCELP